MFKRVLLFTFLYLSSFALKAQNLFADYRFKVLENGDTLLYPFAGGLNSPVFAELDFDGNGVKDLIAFEKTTGRILTFSNTGIAGSRIYRFAPQFAEKIPLLEEWVRSFDYDCDGDLDLLTYTVSYTFNALGEGATRLYRNDFSVATGLVFTLVANELTTYYGSLMKVVPSSPVNLPAFTDVDSDGDMDILTFSLSSNYVEYHKNYSIDSTGSCSGLMFYADPTCWGQFKLSGVANIGILNSNCQQVPDQSNLHSGSVLTAFDQGCDGDMDVINGDILGTNLLYLENGGSAASAFITSQDSLFPSYDIPVNYSNLPGAYLIDADFDGNRDMLISGFGIVGEDYNNVLFYRNITGNCTNQFSYQTNRFLVQDMIDAGTSSTPLFFDANSDGLMDIVAGNDFYYSNVTSQKTAHLALYINTGTATVPEFTLTDMDYADVSTLGLIGAYPAFGDLDGDGDADMLIGNTTGDLIYFQNNGGQPANFVFTTPAYQGIDVGANSMPQLIDVDRDGLIDLLIGERTGVLNYYRNTGSAASPVFALVTSSFGNVNVITSGAIQGNSAPLLYDNNGSYELLVGSESGYIHHYTNIDGNLGGTFTVLDSTYEDIYEPKRVSITQYDIDGDGLADLLCGNFAGGLKLYTHYNINNVDEHTGMHSFNIYPVPAKDILHMESKNGMDQLKCITLYDATGRKVNTFNAKSSKLSIPVSILPQGFYILLVEVNGTMESYKFIRE